MNNPALHIYNRLGFGPRPADLAADPPELESYLESQLYSDTIADPHLDVLLEPYSILEMSAPDVMEVWPTRQERRRVVASLGEVKLLRALTGERQLEELMVDFWFNHFNVFMSKSICAALLPSYERDAIRPHVLGRFRDLLHATARHPAMLVYLDNWLSVSPDVRGVGRRRGFNENYARELMELHTLGVNGGYQQQDVIDVARAFTGWSIQGLRRPVFQFIRRLHDRGSKQVLGRRVPSSGMGEGEAILDQLARHPSTAQFISTKLARRFVSDDPPPGLVDRVARTFMDTGGDLRAVMRTLIISDEFRSAEAQKVKTPFEFIVSALRRVGADVDNLNAVLRQLAGMGQRPYAASPPTGYPDTAAEWMSSGALMSRLNLVSQLAENRLRGVTRPPDFRAQEVIRILGTAEFQRK